MSKRRLARDRKNIGLLATALLAVGLAVGAGCGGQDQSAAMAERPPASVIVASAVTRDVPIYLDQIGSTTARESVVIQPQVTGKIVSVHFADGDEVQQGDLLFTIDPRPYQAALAFAKATLAENQAKLKYARDEVKRMEEIRTTGAVSVQEWEQRVNAVAIAEAQVASAEANLQTAQLNLEYCEIRSPINGRAGDRMVDPGNVVSAGGPDGGTKLLRIQAFDPIYVDFTVTENELGTVRRFMAEGRLPQEDPRGKLKVLVDVPGDARQIVEALGGSGDADAEMQMAQATTAPAAPAPPVSPAQGGATTRPSGSGPREGVLTFLDNIVRQGTGTVRVRATVANDDRYFWPGQFVRVRLVLTVKQNAVLVPALAQQIGQQGAYVYVVEQGTVRDATGKESATTVATLRPIVVGQRQGDMVVVERGLRAGEQVVTQGHLSVAPGGPVMVVPPPGAPPGAAGNASAAATDGTTAADQSEKKS